MKKEKTPEELEKEKKTKIFVARVVAWAMFSCIIPVVFIGWRYSLFSKAGALQLNGWGIIAIIILFVFLFTLIKYIKACFIEWSMIKQVISGIAKIILPLVSVLIIAISIKNSIDYFIQALSCVIVSEVISIPLNPFPKYIYEKTQGKYESMVDYITTKFWEKKGDK